MKITDIKPEMLPLRVKLNKNFDTYEETFNSGMILQINQHKLDGVYSDGECYKVIVVALASDMEYNKTVACRDWYNSETDDYNMNIFESNPRNFDDSGNFHDEIYVMGSEDLFELVDPLTVVDIIKNIPQQSQVQYSLEQQLKELSIAANKLGLSEASDYLKTVIELNY